MPSTARINIAQVNSFNRVTENLDDVWNTQYGRHVSVPVDANATYALTFGPSESYVYFTVMPLGAVGGEFTIFTLDQASGWIVTLPPVIATRFLLPRLKNMDSALFISTIAANASEVFI